MTELSGLPYLIYNPCRVCIGLHVVSVTGRRIKLLVKQLKGFRDANNLNIVAVVMTCAAIETNATVMYR
jgi:hypothetical protein